MMLIMVRKNGRDILWIQLRHTIESEKNENEKELCTRWYFRCVLWRDTLIIIIYCMEQRSSGFLGANSIKKNQATSHAFHLIWFGCYEENCIVCFRFVCLRLAFVNPFIVLTDAGVSTRFKYKHFCIPTIQCVRVCFFFCYFALLLK